MTLPNYINTKWDYLYKFYAKQKYTYIPFCGGRSKNCYLGNLPEQQFKTDIGYLIRKLTIDIPDAYVAKVKYHEERVSDLVKKSISDMLVKKRKLKGKAMYLYLKILKNSEVLYE